MKPFHAEGGIAGWQFSCPGCGLVHVLWTGPSLRRKTKWTLKPGSMDAGKPTFSPSQRVRWPDGKGGWIDKCHFFVTDGNIVFCSDSPHELKGKTVPLPDVKDFDN